jgi:hypothetical protein
VRTMTLATSGQFVSGQDSGFELIPITAKSSAEDVLVAVAALRDRKDSRPVSSEALAALGAGLFEARRLAAPARGD